MLKKVCSWFRDRKVIVLAGMFLAALAAGGTWVYATARHLETVTATTAFEAGAANVPTAVYFQTLYCASDNEKFRRCAADTRGGVRLIRQRSGSPCIQGRTWGFDRSGIWVDRGCRADFELGDRRDRRDRDRDWDRDRDRDRDYDRDRDRGRYVQTFYCESGDGKRHWCSEGIGGDVRLIRQRSGSPCIQGRTWGRDRSGVWVDRGCRADFEVRR